MSNTTEQEIRRKIGLILRRKEVIQENAYAELVNSFGDAISHQMKLMLEVGFTRAEVDEIVDKAYMFIKEYFKIINA